MSENSKSSASQDSESPSKVKEKKKKSKKRPFDPENLIGETLGGRYEVEKCIGRGGMGVVYLASQSALNRKVVVKVLPRSFVDDDEAIARFEREAVGMSRLQHPHIVSIYDFGHEEEQAYICMEYVEGETLSRRIKSKKTMDMSTFGSIALQILEGIGEAHSLGLVHRDIKPSNIMLTDRHGQDNYVKILDFGLAKLVKGAQDVTKEQNLVGSVAFLAPEQIMGNEIDERVDVYALSVLFYYMISGEKPFTGDDDVTVLYQHVHNEADRLEDQLADDHDIPQNIIDLIHRGLSKDPEDRPQDAGEFLADLSACLDGEDVSRPHVSGEFNTVSRVANLNTMKQEDPSAQLDRERHETPMFQPPADATPTGSGTYQFRVDGSSVTDPSQLTWVTGEHVMKVEKQNRLRNILLAVFAVVVIGGVGTFFYIQQSNIPSAETVEKDISRAVALIEEDKLGQAESALEMVERDLQHHPDLRTDYIAARDRLEIEQLISNGVFYEEDGNIKEAIASYKEVLSRNPRHETARERLQGIRAARQAEEGTATTQGSLRVTSEPRAMVFMDDLPLGQTPLSETVSTGTHMIEVRTNGYKSWSKEVTVKDGETLPLGITLQKQKEKQERVKRVAPRPSNRGSSSGRPSPKKKPESTGSAEKRTESSGSSSGSSAPAPAEPEEQAEKDESSGSSSSGDAKPEKTAAAKPEPKETEKEEKSGSDDGLLLPVDDEGSEESGGDDGGDDDGLLLPVGGEEDDEETGGGGDAPLLD
ncbi:MAG: protein kinase domain-containing protein [Myxococcota bacterium]